MICKILHLAVKNHNTSVFILQLELKMLHMLHTKISWLCVVHLIYIVNCPFIEIVIIQFQKYVENIFPTPVG